MNLAHVMQRTVYASGAALLGAIVGLLAAAFGNVISQSVLGALTVIVVAVVLGAQAGRLPGALCGASCGGLIVAFGSVIGGSVSGVVSIIVAGALFAGWCSWVCSSSTNGQLNISFHKRFPHRPQAEKGRPTACCAAGSA